MSSLLFFIIGLVTFLVWNFVISIFIAWNRPPSPGSVRVRIVMVYSRSCKALLLKRSRCVSPSLFSLFTITPNSQCVRFSFNFLMSLIRLAFWVQVLAVLNNYMESWVSNVVSTVQWKKSKVELMEVPQTRTQGTSHHKISYYQLEHKLPMTFTKSCN